MAPDRIGRYEIQRRLGTGGMGSLYLARDPGLDRLVAIKLLKDDYQDDEDLRERFAREARSVARLRHPNIVIVFDVGEDEGRPFMAMEYIAGETLTHVLRRDPPLPLARRLGLMEELCAGLAHAHGAGIVHRDIKPANLMLDGRRCPEDSRLRDRAACQFRHDAGRHDDGFRQLHVAGTDHRPWCRSPDGYFCHWCRSV